MKPKKVKHIMPTVRGLGDVIHLMARPIAQALDAAAGTHLADCAGCARRRATLNRKYPL